ncbi:MAG: hypothetical protein K1Y02_19120 [Candidatus Hydrogenedentes bacterium]|nr:hypothetical protein [Candidatus Hydrogenedentota bacterium]
MRHIRSVSAMRPATADELSTISSLLDLMSSIVGLFSQVLSLFGLGSKTTV